MSMAIGTRNRSLKAPPAWANPDDRDPKDFFSCFESFTGEQWVLLQRDKEILVSGSDIDWAVKSQSVAILGNLKLGGAISDGAPAFGLTMDLEERMWLAACLLAISERRQMQRTAAAAAK